MIWVIPFVAALVAGYLLFGRFEEHGPLISISFKDASGVSVQQTNIEYRGVPIGQVKGLTLSEDRQHALVKVRLRRSAATMARAGSEFWIVRLQGGIENLANFGAAVGTVFSGPYIAILPGTGPPSTEFIGLDSPPTVQERGALHVVLRAAHVGSLRSGTPVLYRGVEVGDVQGFRLSPGTSAVDIDVTIRPQYARLVRSNSRFWNVSGANAHFGLFKGLQIDIQSLRSLLTGGIAFSTPKDEKASPARDGMVFPLNGVAVKGTSHDHRIHLFPRSNRS
ncbi:MAG TPA: MlaD family protein [Thiobacillaceae bacterium]|nr:MlaD family protein [Thiobacillaceae bacterium]